MCHGVAPQRPIIEPFPECRRSHDAATELTATACRKSTLLPAGGLSNCFQLGESPAAGGVIADGTPLQHLRSLIASPNN
jgi:hypothetical protein